MITKQQIEAARKAAPVHLGPALDSTIAAVGEAMLGAEPVDKQESERLTRIAYQLPWAEKCVRLEEENERLKAELEQVRAWVDPSVPEMTSYKDRATAAEQRVKALEVALDLVCKNAKLVDIHGNGAFHELIGPWYVEYARAALKGDA